MTGTSRSLNVPASFFVSAKRIQFGSVVLRAVINPVRPPAREETYG
jgi:hypothetical protein